MSKINIFIFRRDLRLPDNTSLINMLRELDEEVTPVFIFTPEQINPKKNKYFSHPSVQFMIESLHELSDEIKEKGGKLYFFYGDNIKVIKSIAKIATIQSIGYNIDYTPYAKQRDKMIVDYCNDHNIIPITKEDYALYNVMDGTTNKADGTPYLVYTPFLNHVTKLKVREVDRFHNFKFKKIKELEQSKYYVDEKTIDSYYTPLKTPNVQGGRSEGLKILANIQKFNDYTKCRNDMTYKTTFLGASLHFNTLSIREVYSKILDKLGKSSGLIRELVFRDFYMNITHNFPRILEGQINKNKKNKSYKEEYDKINWSYNMNRFKRWTEGMTGFPIVDACMRQLNSTGFMHNRGRMIVASFLTKDLHIDWKLGEQYFATKLIDYDAINNSNGWQWSAGCGTDAQPWFRIFNPWTQQKDYDEDCRYIKLWVEELKDVPNKDIHRWYDDKISKLWIEKGIEYPIPMVDHDEERKETISIYRKALA
jgi:deoxyribodipyrimidine photo-lyase